MSAPSANSHSMRASASSAAKHAVEPVAAAQHRVFAHDHAGPAPRWPAGTSWPVQSPVPMSSRSASRMLRCARLLQRLVVLELHQATPMFGTKPLRGCASAAGMRLDEVEHALDAAQRLAAHRLGHVDLAAAAFPGSRPRPAARSSPSTGSARSSCRWRCCRRWAPRSASCPAPAGACGASGRCRWRRCIRCAVPSTTAFSSCEVEPTTSACAHHAFAATRGAPAPSPADARLRSSSSSSPLNSSCTMQSPFHSSMSAPVCSWM